MPRSFFLVVELWGLNIVIITYAPSFPVQNHRRLTQGSIPVPTYFAYPTKTEFPEKAIIILSDIIGIYNNSQLLADDYANHGYLTVIPDLFHGEAVKLNEFESGLTDLHAWIQNHTPSIVEPVVEMTIKHLREKLGIKKIGGVGYCFGGKVC